jgi:hypothetical protein
MFLGCVSGESPTFWYELKIVHASDSNLSDIKLLFLKTSIQSLEPDNEYNISICRRAKGSTTNGTPDNLPDGNLVSTVFDEYDIVN